MREFDRIEREFYARDTVRVARDLLGKILVRRINGTFVSGVITETEAYRQADDPASHAHRGITERNKVMFGEVGLAYVYFTYGMHYCVNVVAKSKDHAAGAVLIRSIKPHRGVDIMIKNRGVKDAKNLTNGPAKLAMALDITKNQYGEDMVSSKSIYITDGPKTDQRISAGPRVGISRGVDKMWNFRISS